MESRLGLSRMRREPHPCLAALFDVSLGGLSFIGEVKPGPYSHSSRVVVSGLRSDDSHRLFELLSAQEDMRSGFTRT